MNTEELKDILALGHETLRVEVKEGGSPSSKWFFAKVIRAILALANTRDGGNVIIGVSEKSDHSGWERQGVTEGVAAEWKNFKVDLGSFH